MPAKKPARNREQSQFASGGEPRLYEQLRALNGHCQAALIALKGCKRAIPTSEWQYCQLLIEEARALASQSIIEWLNDREISIASIASRRRTVLEKRMFK
jgi:hypothetical protein